LFAVLGFFDFVIGAPEHIADDLAIIRLVLDHQDARAATTLRPRRRPPAQLIEQPRAVQPKNQLRERLAVYVRVSRL
jgi:hypothetical protein